MLLKIILLIIIWGAPWIGPAEFPNSVEGDRQALMDLYKATGGDNWKNNSGWDDGNPSNDWHGVVVDAEGRVVQFDLSGNNLSGMLPESIGNLTKVSYFNVKQNKLSGQIPSSIGRMTSLKYLLLNGRAEDPDPYHSHHPGKTEGGAWSDERSNAFSGPIPPSIGQLESLLFFECMGQGSKTVKDGSGFDNALSGAIPQEIGNLTSLIGLHLDFNGLESLPDSMASLTNLVHLSISMNALRGQGLPEWLGRLTNLKYVWIGYNSLGGSFPDLSNLRRLQIFSSFRNNFEGPFPDYMVDGTMPNINMLLLAWNEFTGTLPDFGENNLAAFSVGWNNLTGELPDLSNLHRIVNLGFDHNNFEGEIPDLSHMYQLRYFRANGNKFTGTLPMVDLKNKKLQALYFQNNNLSGYIDPALAKVTDLPVFKNLNIRGNNFIEKNLRDFKKVLATKGKANAINLDKMEPIGGH